MVETLALYVADGQRLHTTYIAATPEYGKGTFLDRVKLEIERVKSAYLEALTFEIADGALGNLEFLDTYTTRQVLDFYHASEHLTKAADAAFPGKAKECKTWLDDACHR